jgi:hypothetical protein
LGGNYTEMKEKPFLERWHGAHHYPDKVHVLLVLFLFLTIVTLLLSYVVFHNPKIENMYSAFLSPTPTIKPAIQTTPTPQITPTITPPITPTCKPRPACLDMTPKCKIAETPDMCPRPTITPPQVACTMEAKLCPDGKTYVSRSGPNCEFSKCSP